MFERTLRDLQERIHARRHVVTLHAMEEMDDDGLSIFDLESVILTGRIVERQRDRVASGWKYLIRGDTINAQPATVVARLGATGLAVLITVYRDETT